MAARPSVAALSRAVQGLLQFAAAARVVAPISARTVGRQSAEVDAGDVVAGQRPGALSNVSAFHLDTANAHIAEGLIWASLCAAGLKRVLAHAAQRVGGTAMSTRRVAMCAHHILDALVAALLLGIGLRGILRQGLAYLLANARRANPERDHSTGRLRVGLGLVEAA